MKEIDESDIRLMKNLSYIRAAIKKSKKAKKKRKK